MKILFVAPRSPFFPTRGDTLRAYHQLRVLSQRHRVTLVAPRNRDATRTEDQPASQIPCNVVDLHWTRTAALMQLLKAPFSSLPIQVLYVCPPDAAAVVPRLVSTGRFDVVYAQLARMGPVVDRIDAPCVLDYQDAFSLNAERQMRLRSVLWSPALRLEAGRMRQYERTLARKVAFCTVTSADDREALGNPPNCVVIPNGVDLDRFPYRPTRVPSSDIVLTGSMRYPPNADAAEWFATRILPRIRAHLPDARFVIVGADPTRRVRSLARLPGVVVTGYVRSVAEYLGRAAVAVAPLRCATGVQNKVLEAMAAGTPLVATPDAVRGIEAVSGRHLLVGRSEEELATHVRHVLQDPSFAQTLGRRARELVESRYTWEHTVGALEHVFEAAASTRGHAAGLAIAARAAPGGGAGEPP